MTSFLQRLFLHNFGLKVISLALAFGLWLAVAQDHPAEVAVEVSIEFHNIPDNLEISTEHIPRAQIRLRGPERLVRRLQPIDVHAEIDLTTAKPGERTFDLTAQQIHQPYGLHVMQVVPSQFHLAFDSRLTRQVEIHPRVIGSFAAGYSIAKILVDPPVVTISGPSKRVAAVESAITDPVDVSGTIDRGSFVTHAYVPDPMVQAVDPVAVRVTVLMEKTSATSGAGAVLQNNIQQNKK
jgi:YbbR domain-containing protein